ncbi:unnamed protein product [Protopolystoma xenopodis]|uniref:Uncharacterized protein n=1 Tax=Protopolystoma xenopodis TaxID=117903 RepID=A0A3S5FEY4_9PLAT|nr:unnamed protein product [Protopolystoma xenopodis]
MVQRLERLRRLTSARGRCECSICGRQFESGSSLPGSNGAGGAEAGEASSRARPRVSVCRDCGRTVCANCCFRLSLLSGSVSSSDSAGLRRTDSAASQIESLDPPNGLTGRWLVATPSSSTRLGALTQKRRFFFTLRPSQEATVETSETTATPTRHRTTSEAGASRRSSGTAYSLAGLAMNLGAGVMSRLSSASASASPTRPAPDASAPWSPAEEQIAPATALQGHSGDGEAPSDGDDAPGDRGLIVLCRLCCEAQEASPHSQPLGNSTLFASTTLTSKVV